MDTRKVIGLVISVVLALSLVVVFIYLQAPPQNNGGSEDSTPPVIAITGPEADAEVCGAEAITFSATDENGVPRSEYNQTGIVRR